MPEPRWRPAGAFGLFSLPTEWHFTCEQFVSDAIDEGRDIDSVVWDIRHAWAEELRERAKRVEEQA